MNGILNVLKPPGMTSHNVVAYIKRILNVDKVGHTGTLDPGAAGVLPICIGRATRISEYLLNDKKTYRAELQIGFKSDTLDKYGIIEKVPVPVISEENIYSAFEKFKGRIEQLPPMFSAVKHNGKRLYSLAREGIVVDRKIRDAYIYSINILNIYNEKVLFDVTCSKGTYIRTLCSDIGKLLHSDAIMTFLLRTKTGPFEIKNSVTLDELRCIVENNDIDSILHPIEAGLSGYSRIKVNNFISQKVKNGVPFKIESYMDYELKDNDSSILIFDDSNSFIAIGKKYEVNDYIKVDKVFV